MRQVDVLILGAGIAGLGAALKARELDREVVIFEASDTSGGLLDNFEVNGFRFDKAVHLSFASELMVRDIFDQTPFYTHPADAWNFEKDKWLKHPVQNNLYPLPGTEKTELIQSFLQRPDEIGSTDYESWLRHQYGDAITERYPLRYTQKYWGTCANKLSTTWIGDRMRRAKLEEILLGAFTSDTPNTYYTKEMRYPKRGGFKAFIQPLIDQSKIIYCHGATQVDLDKNTVTFNNKEKVRYSQLVSTMPLPELIKICASVPELVVEAASKLVATSIDLISIGFNKPIVNDLWFYIYDEDILASRAYSPSVKSPDNAPNGCSSLQFEIYSRGNKSRYSVEELFANTKYALEKMDIASEEDVLFMRHKHLPWGNVIFDIGMEENRETVRKYIDSFGVASCGRFGEWDYLWSNQSLLSGYNSIK